MHLQGTWTDGQTDGQGDSYIPPQTLFAGGIIKYIVQNITKISMTKIKISNAPKMRKPSCEHVDGQCDHEF